MEPLDGFIVVLLSLVCFSETEEGMAVVDIAEVLPRVEQGYDDVTLVDQDDDDLAVVEVLFFWLTATDSELFNWSPASSTDDVISILWQDL